MAIAKVGAVAIASIILKISTTAQLLQNEPDACARHIKDGFAQEWLAKVAVLTLAGQNTDVVKYMNLNKNNNG